MSVYEFHVKFKSSRILNQIESNFKKTHLVEIFIILRSNKTNENAEVKITRIVLSP